MRPPVSLESRARTFLPSGRDSSERPRPPPPPPPDPPPPRPPPPPPRLHEHRVNENRVARNCRRHARFDHLREFAGTLVPFAVSPWMVSGPATTPPLGRNG